MFLFQTPRFFLEFIAIKDRYGIKTANRVVPNSAIYRMDRRIEPPMTDR